MPGSISQNELSRFRTYVWVVLIGVSVWLVFGWGCSRETAETAESQGEKPGIKAERVTWDREVEAARKAGSNLAGPMEVDQQSEVESGGSYWVKGDLSEDDGRDDAGSLQRENDALRRENFRLQERLDGMTGSGGRLKAQTASYPSGESEILEEELLVKQEEIGGLLMEREQLEDELEKIVGVAALLQEEVEKLESEREGLSVEDILLLQDEINRLQRENEKRADRIEELGATIEYLEAKLSGMAPEGIAVIAPSEETLEIAEQIRMRLGLGEILPKVADRVLVVVLSDLENPLSYSYGLYGDLAIEANQQMDVKASMFHAYIYQINDDLSVQQIEHTTGYY